MIQKVLTYLGVELGAELGISDPAELVVGAVRSLDPSDNSNRGKVAISLVNVIEESTLRNTSHHIRVGDQSFYKEPPVHLNLYVLFSFETSAYATALDHLSKTVELFQRKKIHSTENEFAANSFPPGLERLSFDLYSMKFDELNHMWGVLGADYLPSLVYRVRLVRIQNDIAVDANAINSVELQSSEIQ